MSDRSGAELSLSGRLWIGFIVMLGMTLLIGACTRSRDSTNTETQHLSDTQDSSRHQDSAESMRGETFSLVYIDASEAENRQNLQLWLQQIRDHQSAAQIPWMVYFSSHNEPVVSADSASFPHVRRALVRQFPPIPKPMEEADRVVKHLQAISSSWKNKDLVLHCFFSGSFHDISLTPFFDRLLEGIGPYDHSISLTIYTEVPVPEGKYFHHSALTSISYIQLTNDHLL